MPARFSLPGSAALLVTLALGAVALPTHTAAAQTGSVGATLRLVGLPEACISADRVGSATLSANCSTTSEEPGWCPFMQPNGTAQCGVIGRPWRDIGLDEVSGKVLASNTNGQLRVETELVVETQAQSSSTPGYNLGYGALARAEWYDVLDIGPAPVGGWPDGTKVEFLLWVHGAMSIDAGAIRTPGIVDHNTTSRFRWNFDMNTNEPFNSSDWDGVSQIQSTDTTFSKRHQDRTFAELRTHLRPISAFERFLGFKYGITSDISVPPGPGYNTDYVIASYARGAFGNTAGLAGVRVLNASGTEIANVNYSFANGTQFVGPATTVPEPSTWAMLGTGIGLLGMVARRRAARA